MATKKILLAYDSSDGSQKALEWTIEYAKKNASEVHVVTVIDSAGWITLEPMSQLIDLEEMRSNYLRKLNEATQTLCDGFSCSVQRKVLEGNPTAELLQYAKEEKVDLIICGSHGMSNIGAMLLGSVAHKLVTYAACPVVVVK